MQEVLCQHLHCLLQFHLENAKARAKQRLEDGRGEAIDILVRDLMLGDLFDVGAEPPYNIFEGLTLPEMRDLHEELEEYQVRASNK